MLLSLFATVPSADVLIDQAAGGYAAPDVPTGALHPIWGILLSAAMVAAVVAVSLMSSKRSLTE